MNSNEKSLKKEKSWNTQGLQSALLGHRAHEKNSSRLQKSSLFVLIVDSDSLASYRSDTEW